MLFCLSFDYHVEKNISSQSGPLSVWLAGSPHVCPPTSQPHARVVTWRVDAVPVPVSVGG